MCIFEPFVNPNLDIEGLELWERGSQGQSRHPRSEWTSLTLSSVVPSVTMAPVLSAACKTFFQAFLLSCFLFFFFSFLLGFINLFEDLELLVSPFYDVVQSLPV